MSMEISTETLWITPIVEYITKKTLPRDKNESKRLKYQAARYVIYDGTLYKRGFNRPLLRCIAGDECEYIMREIHEGICGKHLGTTSLTHKILHQGYYWPTLQKDIPKYTRACDHCQRFVNFNISPTAPLKPLSSP